MAMAQMQYHDGAIIHDEVTIKSSASGSIIFPIATYGVIVQASVSISGSLRPFIVTYQDGQERFLANSYFSANATIETLSNNTNYTIDYISIKPEEYTS